MWVSQVRKSNLSMTWRKRHTLRLHNKLDSWYIQILLNVASLHKHQQAIQYMKATKQENATCLSLCCDENGIGDKATWSGVIYLFSNEDLRHGDDKEHQVLNLFTYDSINRPTWRSLLADDKSVYKINRPRLSCLVDAWQGYLQNSHENNFLQMMHLLLQTKYNVSDCLYCCFK